MPDSNSTRVSLRSTPDYAPRPRRETAGCRGGQRRGASRKRGGPYERRRAVPRRELRPLGGQRRGASRKRGGPSMTFDWSVVWQHREALLAATGTTIVLTVATMAIAVPCGILVAVLRLYAWAPVRALATAYVELFRNLPLILVVFWAFYVLPILIGVGLSPVATGLAALALNV